MEPPDTVCGDLSNMGDIHMTYFLSLILNLYICHCDLKVALEPCVDILQRSLWLIKFLSIWKCGEPKKSIYLFKMCLQHKTNTTWAKVAYVYHYARFWCWIVKYRNCNISLYDLLSLVKRKLFLVANNVLYCAAMLIVMKCLEI